jgi:flagellin
VEAASDTAFTDNAAAANSTFTITSNNVTTANITNATNYSAAETAAAINSATAAGSTGVTATATNVAYLGNFSGLEAADVMAFTIATGGSTGYSSAAITETISDANDLSSVVQSINNAGLGVTASQVTLASGVALKLESTDGRDIAINDFGFDTSNTSATASGTVITSAGLAKDVSFTNGRTITANGALGDSNTDSAVATGQVTLTGSKGAITVSALADFDNTTSTKSALSALSITTATTSQTALQTVDAVLDQVTSARGDLGAYQNRFESVVANLQVTAENLSASRSRIVDADFAAETAALTKAQILQQSGIAMLAQANAIPQNVLALLQ